MKTLKWYTLSLLLILIMESCKRNNEIIDQPGTSDEKVTASIIGTVINESGNPVTGATIKVGSANLNTDRNGSFAISNTILDKNAAYVQVEKDGYFTGSRTFRVQANTTNFIKVQLIKRSVIGTVSATNGGSVTVPSGGKIDFPANSFINQTNNSVYSGTVSVSAFALDPTASNFLELMPGALRGISASNQETGMQSYSMMAIELKGANNEPLNLAPNKRATLTLPIPELLQVTAPATIPLWYFDDKVGLWKEEGTATKQGTSYVGTVAHFSFWNADAPLPLVNFKVKIVGQNNQPLARIKVTVSMQADSAIVTGADYSDSLGIVSGMLPANKSLVLSVYDSQRRLVFRKAVGPLSADEDFGTIQINNSLMNIRFFGNVYTCFGSLNSKGHVEITINGTTKIAKLSNSSLFLDSVQTIPGPTIAYLRAFDSSNNSYSYTAPCIIWDPTHTYTVPVTFCQNSMVEFIDIGFRTLVERRSYMRDTISCVQSGNETVIYLSKEYAIPTSTMELRFDNPTSTGRVKLNYLRVKDGSRVHKMLGEEYVQINEYNKENNLIVGSLSCLVEDSAYKVTSVYNCNFRLKRS